MDLHGLRHLGHSDLGRRAEGLQVVGTGNRAFTAHLFSGGVTEVDLTDPTNPRPLSFIPAPAATWSVHLQVQDELLLVANGPDMWSAPDGFDPGRTLFATGHPFAAGVRVFDISRWGAPREIGFADVGGAGVHRIWFDGTAYAYVSGFPPGHREGALLVLDMTVPEKPVEVDRYWIPGMQPGEEGAVTWPADQRVSLHHATIRDGYAYGAWRDGGITRQPVGRDGMLGTPTRLSWVGPDGRGCVAHTALSLPGSTRVVVAEEGIESDGEPQERVVAIVDVAGDGSMRRVGALPRPNVEPVPGARFGPHNLYEYRPGAWEDGSLVFSAHQASGLRVYAMAGDGSAEEVAHYLGDPPRTLLDPRPDRALVSSVNDVFVTAEGLLVVVDANRGLDVLELAV